MSYRVAVNGIESIFLYHYEDVSKSTVKWEKQNGENYPWDDATYPRKKENISTHTHTHTQITL